MKKLSPQRRARATGRGAAPPHLSIPHWIIDTPRFADLKGSPLKLLIDLARQYNGFNNGNLAVALIRHRWRSRETVQSALEYLIAEQWILKTRQGGLGMGPDLFAVTWWPIDECKDKRGRDKHDYAAEAVASHLWNKKTASRNPVLVVPKIGTGDEVESSEFDESVPKSGTGNDDLQAA